MHNTIIILTIACFSLILHADDSDDILQSKVTFQKGVILEGWEERFQPKKEELSKPEPRKVEQKQKKTTQKKHSVTHIKRTPKPLKQPVKTADEKPLEIVKQPPEKPEIITPNPAPRKEEKPEKKEPRVEKKQPIKEETKQQKDNDGKKTRKDRLKELKKRQRGDSFKNRKVD